MTRNRLTLILLGLALVGGLVAARTWADDNGQFGRPGAAVFAADVGEKTGEGGQFVLREAQEEGRRGDEDADEGEEEHVARGEEKGEEGGEQGRAHSERRPEVPQPLRQTFDMVKLLEHMQSVCFDPAQAGMIAIGGLKNDVRRPEAEVVAELEGALTKTKSLGLRNALRMTLKDMYKKAGNNEMVLKHLRAMIEENDAALQKEK